jgi:putative endonuclease
LPLFARLMFGLVSYAARKGLAEDRPEPSLGASRKLMARQAGIRGETYAYWYLRRHGYLLVARNFMTPGLKGEIDLVGYDGPVLAFVEVKTRTGSEKTPLRPEDAVTSDKRRNLCKMAKRFLRERRIVPTPCRFDVLAIESRAGRSPQARLHKGAFSSQMW